MSVSIEFHKIVSFKKGVFLPDITCKNYITQLDRSLHSVSGKHWGDGELLTSCANVGGQVLLFKDSFRAWEFS